MTTTPSSVPPLSGAQAPANIMHIRTSAKGGEGVDVVVNYNCGCGFQTSNLRDAVEHAFRMGHKMEIRGRVEVSR